MALMVQEHQFKRTKRQYERIFKKWDMKKNSKANQWKYLAYRVGKRQAEGKESSVWIGTDWIQPKKLQKELSRYGYQSTVQKMQRAVRRSPSPMTPPGILVFTPQPSPTDHDLQLDVPASPAQIVPITMQMIYQWARTTPWRQFVAFSETIQGSSSAAILYLPETPDPIYCGTVLEDGCEPIELVPRTPTSHLQKWLDELSEAMFLNSSCLDIVLPFSCMHPNAFMPPQEDGIPGIDVTATLDLARKSSQLEFLKLAVHLLSNNSRAGMLANSIVELCQDGRNLSLLQSLLSQSLLSIKAFAEKLLAPAAGAGNMPLVEMLVNSGVDVDRRAASGDTGFGGATALECAVRNGRDDMVKLLLDRHGTPPDFRTIRAAAKLDDPEILKVLLSKDLSQAKELRRAPWCLFEAAAKSGNCETFQYLLEYGLDFKATDSFGRGSPLAVAASNGNKQVVLLLLDLGADIHGVGPGVDPWGGRPWKSRYSGLEPLHASLINENGDLVRILLERGANPNHCPRSLYPIHIAANCGDEKTVGLLLEKGADPNVVIGERVDSLAFRSGFDSGPTAIDFALRQGNMSIVDLLIKHGADLCAAQDPLASALISKDFEVLEWILRAQVPYQKTGAALTACIQNHGCELARRLIAEHVIEVEHISPAAICAAVYKRDPEFVQFLLFSAVACFGRLPMSHGVAGIATSAKFHCADMIRIFLDAGLKPYTPVTEEIQSHDPYYEIPKGSNAFQELFGLFEERYPLFSRELDKMPENRDYQEWMESLRLLIDACSISNCGLQDADERRLTLQQALSSAIRYDCLPAVRMLFDAGVSANYSDNHISPLQSAMDCGRYELAELLLKQGAYVNAAAIVRKHLSWHTPLQYAAMANNIHLARLFLAHGGEVNAEPAYRDGATALQFAAINGNFESFNLLLEAGAHLNAPPGRYDGRTAIEGAAEHGRLDMVRYILEADADTRGKRNKNYRRSVFRAWKEGHRTVARMIQDFKAEKFGVEDCDSTDNIIRTITCRELYFVNEEAAERFLTGRGDVRHCCQNYPCWYLNGILSEEIVTQLGTKSHSLYKSERIN